MSAGAGALSPCRDAGDTRIVRIMSDTSTRSRALLYWGAAAAALLLGYVDLARGGETIAPILLVLGYVVLVPLAIVKG
jgi:hypothetical protein